MGTSTTIGEIAGVKFTEFAGGEFRSLLLQITMQNSRSYVQIDPKAAQQMLDVLDKYIRDAYLQDICLPKTEQSPQQ